eukprot:SAG31_NODE_11505_length_1023_cov_0.933983_1_plen_127_part_00
MVVHSTKAFRPRPELSEKGQFVAQRLRLCWGCAGLTKGLQEDPPPAPHATGRNLDLPAYLTTRSWDHRVEETPGCLAQIILRPYRPDGTLAPHDHHSPNLLWAYVRLFYTSFNIRPIINRQTIFKI